MRIRLTTIALHHDGRRFAEGEVVVAGDDIPLDLAEARLRAGTAELAPADGDEVSPAMAEALGQLQLALTAFLAAARQAIAVADATEQPFADLRALFGLVAAQRDVGDIFDIKEAMDRLNARLGRVEEETWATEAEAARAAQADQAAAIADAADKHTEGGAAAPAAVETHHGDAQDAAPSDAAASPDAPAAADVSGGVAPTPTAATEPLERLKDAGPGGETRRARKGGKPAGS